MAEIEPDAHRAAQAEMHDDVTTTQISLRSIAISLKRIADFVDKLPISSDLGHDLRHIMHNAGQDFAQGMRGNT